MDAAFGLVVPAPAAVALVLAVGDARRAGHAADRAEAVGDQRMLGQIVELAVGGEVVLRPVGERVDLDALAVGLDQRQVARAGRPGSACGR